MALYEASQLDTLIRRTSVLSSRSRSEPEVNVEQTDPNLETIHTHAERTAIELPRQTHIQIFVLIYAAMLIAGWTILAVTSRRPIGRASYYLGDEVDGYYDTHKTKSVNERTQAFISNAHILLSIVAVLTIPLTSTVCAAAAIPWLQQSGQEISLRQLVTLADRGWTSPYIYSKLVTPSGWRRYGSSFIALSFLLNCFGAGLSPAISKATRTVNTKAAISVATTFFMASVSDLIDDPGAANGEVIMRLRDELRTNTAEEYQPRLWQQPSWNCSRESPENYDFDMDNIIMAEECVDNSLSYADLPTLKYPWISELPNGFSTGVVSNQIIPRINSSVNVTEIGELPFECALESAAFSVTLSGNVTSEFPHPNAGDLSSYSDAGWLIKACVSQYDSKSRFEKNATRPQTITEILYLDLNSYLMESDRPYIGVKYKVEVNTTLGYFELPNIGNSNTAGDLMANYTPPPPYYRFKERDESTLIKIQNNETNPTHELEATESKGPLLNIAYALFGDGSYPATFAMSNETYNTGYSAMTGENYTSWECRDVVPLSHLSGVFSVSGPSPEVQHSGCLSNLDLSQMQGMHYFVENLALAPEDLENVFLAAAYMSHQVWFTAGARNAGFGAIEAQYDPGVDLQKPNMGDHTIVALSLAIALFLTCLFALST